MHLEGYCIDTELFEELAIFYGDLYRLPPLAARIFAYLALDFSREGVCFEFLVNETDASKSSVSNSLNTLHHRGLVTYCYRLNSRMRLYKLNPANLRSRFNRLIDQMSREKALVIRLEAEKKRSKIKNSRLDRVYKAYKQSLDKSIDLLNDTKEKIEAIN